MGNALYKFRFARGPGGTSFPGDIKMQRAYGLPLASHPVQQIIPKAVPANYIATRLYPVEGETSKFFPRQYVIILRLIS